MTEPTNAAMRAAREIARGGAWYKRTEVAEIIDRQTGLPELLACLHEFVQDAPCTCDDTLAGTAPCKFCRARTILARYDEGETTADMPEP